MLFNRRPVNRRDQEPIYPPQRGEVSVVCPPRAEPTQSLIDASVGITGDLQSQGDVQVDGHICGNVECAQLIVGRDAVITGTIVAEEVVVRGRIRGTIRARLVILQDTARVESDIAYALLAVDDGARFEGTARRRADPLRDEDGARPLTELQRLLTAAEVGADGAAKVSAAPTASRTEPRSLRQRSASDNSRS